MRRLEYTNQFKSDLLRIQKNPSHQKLHQLLQSTIDLLLQNKPLPIKLRDHALKGKYLGTRECHLKPDLLLIYMRTNDALVLIRLGSHSELF